MPRQPDIFLIVTTQWRGQALGCAGDPNARTPELDAMASEGTAFTRAVTPHPFGPFARAALLTGRPSPENGVAAYFDPLPRDARTLAHELAARGYATAFIGKWHLAPRRGDVPLVGEDHARQPVAREDQGGFAHWEGFEGGFQLENPWLQGTDIGPPLRFQGYQADVLCERATHWWMRHSAQPRFCLLSLEPPHPPYAAPAAGVPPRDPATIVLPGNVPPGGEIEARARRELAGYYAHIEAVDRALGRLLALPELTEAIIAVTSVHGDMHGAHGLFRKGWPHEESLRVPLIVRFPPEAPVAAGSVRDDPVSLLDLRRWILGWAEGGFSTDCGDATLCSMPCVVALPHQCDRPWKAVLTRRWKLVLGPDGSPWLLFDRGADPLEQANLAARPELAPVVSELSRRFAG